MRHLLPATLLVFARFAAGLNGLDPACPHRYQLNERASDPAPAPEPEPGPDPVPELIIKTVWQTTWAEAVTTVWATDDGAPTMKAAFAASSESGHVEQEHLPDQRNKHVPKHGKAKAKAKGKKHKSQPHAKSSQIPHSQPALSAALEPQPPTESRIMPSSTDDSASISVIELATFSVPLSTPTANPSAEAQSSNSDTIQAADTSGCAHEGTLEPWQKEVLDAHNDRRGRHPVAPQCWHEGLAAAAAKAASLCNWSHTLDAGKDICGFEQGFMQNYAASSSDGDHGAQVKSQWYDREEPHYDRDGDYELDNPKPTPLDAFGSPEYETGHFSAMVWKDSTYVGCAKQFCPAGISGLSGEVEMRYFLVCDYALPGNMGGEYRTQVLRPRVG